jgi:hypothetical protein
MARLYCSDCDREEASGAKFCSKCGGKLTPFMRVVIMPFVESGQDTGIDPEYQPLVEQDGPLPLTHSIGCQMFISSDIDSIKLVSTQREQFFNATGKILPELVKSKLDKIGYYQVPDTGSVDAIAKAAGDMPTELFLLIQQELDPDFLFLPDVNCFFFRYPHPYGKDEITASGFAFVQISAFLLDNRENKIMSRGTGAALVKFELPPDVQVTEEFTIEGSQQLHTMTAASKLAVNKLLTNMKMI